MNIVLRVSSTFLVVADMYLVIETPEKLKKAMEIRVSERNPYSWGSLYIWVNASEIIRTGDKVSRQVFRGTLGVLEPSVRIVSKLKAINNDEIHGNLQMHWSSFVFKNKSDDLY